MASRALRQPPRPSCRRERIRRPAAGRTDRRADRDRARRRRRGRDGLGARRGAHAPRRRRVAGRAPRRHVRRDRPRRRVLDPCARRTRTLCGVHAQGTLRITGLGFADPNSWAAYVQTQPRTTMDSWFPTLPDRVRGRPVGRAACRGRRVHERGVSAGAGLRRLRLLDGRRRDLLEWARRRARVSRRSRQVPPTRCSRRSRRARSASWSRCSLLGARVVFERRRTGLELAAARGASDGRLRGTLALEGLLIGVPAALIGGAIGTLLVAADAGSGGWIIAACVRAHPCRAAGRLGARAQPPAASSRRRTRARRRPLTGGPPRRSSRSSRSPP